MSEFQVIPAEDIAYHTAFDAVEDGPMPFGWHVLVLEDLDALSRFRAQDRKTEHHDPERLAYAYTKMYNEPSEDGTIGEMYFVKGWLYVGMVAHEALHLASWVCRFPADRWPVEGRQQTRVARMTMGREPELLAEITGVLTSVTWYNLENDGMVTVDQ